MGEQGELVLTTLAKEAQPAIRYRTRDITRLIEEPCACGRTQLRMEKIKGRSDDMLIIRGVNVFPSQIESVLVGQPGIGPHYEIVVTREHFTDHLQVKVELVDASLLEKYSELEKVRDRIRAQLRTVLQLDVEVTLVSPNTLKRFEGKAKRRHGPALRRNDAMDEKMLTDDVFVADPVEERLMLGNEAVAQGAWEAGLRVAARLSRHAKHRNHRECVAQFRGGRLPSGRPMKRSPLEVAFGAAMAGARAMTCMKHVGVNVAADPLFTAAYTGVNGGPGGRRVRTTPACTPARTSRTAATMPARPTSPCSSRRTASECHGLYQAAPSP